MLIQTTREKFEIDPAYDKEKALLKRIDEVRDALYEELACVDAIKNMTLQKICLFSMIDQLAQEYANYPDSPRTAKSTFCQFVLKYQKQCDYLQEVEPITLYYHIIDLIDEVEPLPGFPPEKEITLDSLGDLYTTKVKDILKKGKTQEILDYIEKKEGTDFALKKAKEHQLITLLYRMRSKAVHEMSSLGNPISFEQRDFHPTEPYYREIGRCYVEGEEIVTDDAIELIIPNDFLRNIFIDCIEGYLADCKANKHFPFDNNRITRKHVLTWYDT